MKTVLVTGGAGFLGTHMCLRLLAQGHRVIAVDNLSTGSRDNLALLQVHKNFTFIHHDIIYPLTITEPLDCIYNLACPASPPRYQADPIQTTKTSVYGAVNMLTLAYEHKARILQASTSEVYGDPLEHPQKEEYRGNVNPIGIRACYDEGKRCAESLFFDHRRMYGTSIKVARIFNTYGPLMDPADGRVVSNFMVNALKGEPMVIYGNGLQTRSFCYVDDLISGLIALMESDELITGPLNLGNPQEFTVHELAQMVLAMTDSSSSIIFKPLPQDDPVLRCPDITKVKQLLNWQPTVSLEQGLKETMSFFKKTIIDIKSRKEGINCYEA